MLIKQLRPCADKTRQVILEAARKMFAKKGFSGTSINDISKAAKVNLNLIYHHFGSKEKLWVAVKVEVTRNYTPVNCENCALKTFLRYIIVNRTEFFNKNPDFLRIIHWQSLEPHQERFGFAKVIVADWLRHIKRLQQAGEIRKNLDPYLIIVLIIAVDDGAHREAPDELNTAKPERQKEY